MSWCPYKGRPGETAATPGLEILGQKYCAAEISAMIPPKLKEAAEAYLGQKVTSRDHRSGVFQRRPAAGDQGRRQDRRSRRKAQSSMSHRRGARLRPG